jgi:RNA polymerase sigma-70 factor (ECF subfamily)
MVLLLKRDTFEMGTNFIAWAFRVAFFKATTWRRDRMREGRVVLRGHSFEQIAALAEEHFEKCPPIDAALAACLDRLPPAERELLHLKYVERKSLVDHAAQIGQSAQSLHKKISRLRFALRTCIRKYSKTPN